MKHGLTETRSNRLRVVIVEDEPLFRGVMAHICEKQGRLEVVATIGSGDDASVILKQESPDLVVLDLGLPGLDGFSLIQQCRERGSNTKFLVVTANSDDYTLFRISRAGVSGMVDKRTDDLSALQAAIRALSQGEDYFSIRYVEAALRREEADRAQNRHLTERERAVLMLVGLGLSNQEIGARLKISADTAERHRNTLFLKLDVCRTPKLMQLALASGFTKIPPGGDGSPVFP